MTEKPFNEEKMVEMAVREDLEGGESCSNCKNLKGACALFGSQNGHKNVPNAPAHAQDRDAYGASFVIDDPDNFYCSEHKRG